MGENRPVIVQSDQSLLLEVDHPNAAAARTLIAAFAELEKSPAGIHTYRLTPLSLWNAAAAGISGTEIMKRLESVSRYSIPDTVSAAILEITARWGRLHLRLVANELQLVATDAQLLQTLEQLQEILLLLGPRRSPSVREVPPQHRGLLKQALMAAEWPVIDEAGYQEGEALAITFRHDTVVRTYQQEAAEAFYGGGAAQAGSGVVVLPPGAGKTMVGITAMVLAQQSTLILTSSRTSVYQWQRELLSRTSLLPEQIAEYGASSKQIAPVTIATYQMLTHRTGNGETFPHLQLFDQRDWGLIIYDEVHLLPAPIFRATAKLQAKRRLGLTATLVREDGRESDVFALVGPKRYELPWRELEQQGWIASAQCVEVRTRLAEDQRLAYALAENRDRYRIAATNPRKIYLLRDILAQHSDSPALIIGQYLDQLAFLADNLGVPLLTGKTSQAQREALFAAFRQGEERLLILSKIGNFALDLPDAALLIQVSGTFGSRQEEAQRLGRILRPKPRHQGVYFYSLVTRETVEVDFAMRRQLFLAEQGYRYTIIDAEQP